MEGAGDGMQLARFTEIIREMAEVSQAKNSLDNIGLRRLGFPLPILQVCPFSHLMRDIIHMVLIGLLPSNPPPSLYPDSRTS